MSCDSCQTNSLKSKDAPFSIMYDRRAASDPHICTKNDDLIITIVADKISAHRLIDESTYRCSCKINNKTKIPHWLKWSQLRHAIVHDSSK